MNIATEIDHMLAKKEVDDLEQLGLVQTQLQSSDRAVKEPAMTVIPIDRSALPENPFDVLTNTPRLAAEVSSPARPQLEPDWRDLNRELGCIVAHRSHILKALAAIVDITKGLLPSYLYDGTSRDEVVALREAYAEAKRVTEEYPMEGAASSAMPVQGKNGL